jgi:hypothetical protein
MPKQVAAVALLMLLFAGLGSSAVLTRALAQRNSLTAIQQEKRLGPKPIPRWYWRWQAWRLGEGYAKGHPLQPKLRPKDAPRRIPSWAWQRLHFFLLAREQRALAGTGKGSQHGRHPTTTTVTTTTPTTTTTATTSGGTTTTSSGGGTYEDAIAYAQTRPAFSPSRTISVSSAAQLQSAISNLQAGDLVQATAPFIVSGETVIKNRLSAPAELDLSGVQFVYSGGNNLAAVYLSNASNIRIYGGDLSTADTGGSCMVIHGSQYVLWWGFKVHDCGGSGVAAFTSGASLDHLDLQGEITKVGQNLAWDPHIEKGTGEHGAILWDSNYSYAFANNRFAFYAHDIPTGACVEVGSPLVATGAGGNVLYEKCVNATDVATIQTGGNALQLWGDTSNLGLDVKYLEGENLQGYAVRDAGVYSGQTCKNSIVEYGRASNTNQNPRYAGQNPWMTDCGVGYQDVQPSP